MGVAAGIWSRSSIKEFFREDPERMAICCWIFEVQRVGEASPHTVEDPPGFSPTLPVRHPDYQKDPVASMLLWLLTTGHPEEDIHISISTARLLEESGIRWYVYSDPAPLVDAVCDDCGGIVRVPAGRACWLCDDCAEGYSVIGEVDCEQLPGGAQNSTE